MAVKGAARIPVYLVTGFLGSGKTTLLARWLKQPGLAQAVVIVNEYGEVGLDDRLLATATDLPDMVAGGCVCCTGLAGLSEALENLFWARLHREIPAFDAVVIETTGLAEPGPIADSFALNALLRERFHLAAVVVTVAATGGAEVLAGHDSAREQVEGADVVIVTKVDRATPAERDALTTRVRGLHASVPILASAQGALPFADVLAAADPHHETIPLSPHAAPTAAAAHQEDPDHAHGHHDHDHDHSHDHGDHHHLDGVDSRFVPVDEALDDQGVMALVARLRAEHGAALLRAKGIVRLQDGGHAVVQVSPGETFFDVAPIDASAQLAGADAPTPGLTVIVKRA